MTPGFEGLLQPGNRAPDFTLLSVQTDRRVSLADYRNGKGLFLGLFRGLYCPFCRRAIAQMAASAQRLKPLGIESLGVVATDLENARLYYRFNDACRWQSPDARDASLHRVPKPDITAADGDRTGSRRRTGNYPHRAAQEAAGMLDKLDGFQRTAADRRDSEHSCARRTVSIDRDGVIGGPSSVLGRSRRQASSRLTSSWRRRVATSVASLELTVSRTSKFRGQAP
jgi:thiol-disulfide isomerase/thioredoxin